MTGIILAGGRNTRIGTNKAFLEINGARLIDRTITIFQGIFEDIIVVTNSPLSYLDQNVTIVTDILENKGALGGLYTGLFFASSQRTFVCACDMPFLDGHFIRYMIEHCADYDVVVPYSGDGLQPLHAIYGKKCLPAMLNHLERDRLKIIDLYKGLKVLTIKEDIIASFDMGRKMFLNINTRDDLKHILPA
ncbi:MAG: molybdenum cofactor guanylyltransferase [Syntrophales bacterium]|nr:molybdenum cofactor guanylyltransferase [Syntrophales bacterium]